ncbi:Imm74 family immunity protein [Butyrivibrio sp. INlla14]|uniref:Imm74 family immunity protein n=1 Tax=Butyrivibrio sp. INlla14 TaxID=1520808 RepID=UPI0008761FEF|nr:Imm74 family immunity protein [Butyrivibrio sp. INlla14]SCY74980.1 Immunity protein 74 [Butyrivibrio sp. INlla14]
MKIRGGRDYIKFDLENGYIVKAEGEMLIGGKFVVYKNTMKAWEPPHENEEFCEKDIEGIIAEVQRITTKDTVQLVFE